MSGPAGAAPGDLDLSFGRNGVVRPQLALGSGYQYQSIVDMAVGPENAIFLLEEGSCPSSACATLFVVRYRPDGTLDRSFGSTGTTAVTSMIASYAHSSLTVDGEGRPLIASANQQGMVLYRLEPDGRLDAAFGTNGQVAIASEGPEAVNVLVDPHGKIVVAGSWLGRPTRVGESGPLEYPTKLLVAKFQANGAPDPGFGSGGFALLTIANTAESVETMSLRPGGGALFASTFYPEGPGISRVLRDGSLDSGFSPSLAEAFAHLRHRPEAGLSLVAALIPRSQGRLDILGFAAGLFGRGFVARFLPDGAPDSRFGRGGAKLLRFSVDAAMRGDGGSVFATGYSKGRSARVVFRLRADDSFDRTFGAGAGIPVPETEGSFLQDADLGIGSNQRPVLFEPGFPQCPREYCPPKPRLFRFLGGVSRARCFGRRATIVGTKSGETLRGTRHRDVIAALGGDDTVEGFGGGDLICGGRGIDALVDGSGRDRIRR